MRVSRQKAAENRERIIEAAGALFRAKGFNGVGVADIMRAADLTHGGFYGHFASKDDLVAQASQRTMEHAAENWAKITATTNAQPYAALLKRYLSPGHRDDPGHGCVFSALSVDAARCGKAVHTAFAEGLEPLIAIVAQSLPQGTKAQRRRQAVAAVAALIGALILARAVAGTALSDEILAAAQRELLAAVGL